MVVRLLSDTADLTATLRKFDASRAKCFLKRDRHFLLGVIDQASIKLGPNVV